MSGCPSPCERDAAACRKDALGDCASVDAPLEPAALAQQHLSDLAGWQAEPQAELQEVPQAEPQAELQEVPQAEPQTEP